MHHPEEHMRNIKPEGLSTEERGRIWATIAASITAQPSPRSTAAVASHRLLKKVIAFIVIFGILLSGTATASAQSAMPGDWLFPVKIATEKARILLARDKQKKEDLRIKFAEARLAEVRTLLDTTIADPEVATAIAESTVGTSQTATTTANATTSPTSMGTGTSTASSETVTLYLPEQAVKKIERTERAMEIALRELQATREKLAREGSVRGLLVLDEIIAELNGTGSGAVTITKIAAAADEKKNGKTRVTIKAIVTKQSTTTPTVANMVTIDDRDNRTKITMRSSNAKTEITLREQPAGEQPEVHSATNSDYEDSDDNEKHDANDKRVQSDKKKSWGKVKICHRENSRRSTIEVSNSALSTHLAHDDTLGACGHHRNDDGRDDKDENDEDEHEDEDENEDEDTDNDEDDIRNDTIPPVISALTANPGTTTVIITFATNEPTETELYIGTSTPIPTTLPNAIHRARKMAHSYALAGLLSSTTYHYLIVAIDRFGNRATSSPDTFTTGMSDIFTSPATHMDTMAPEISTITTEAGTTSATIGWTTSEAAKSTVWLATTSPLSIPNAIKWEETGYATAHTVLFSELSSGTTYHFIISATDPTGNHATTSEYSLVTISPPSS